MPTPKMLEPLLLTAAAVGVDLDISSSKGLADSLDGAVVSSEHLCIGFFSLVSVCIGFKAPWKLRDLEFYEFLMVFQCRILCVTFFQHN